MFIPKIPVFCIFLTAGTILSAGVWAADITVTPPSTVNVAEGNSDTITAGLTGAGTVTKTGDGAVVLGAQFTGYTGLFDVQGGTLKLFKVSGPLGNTATIQLGAGTTLDINGATVENGTGIVTTGAATITSSQQNTQNGINNLTIGGNLTLDAATRWCVTDSTIDAGGYDIIKTGSNELLFKTVSFTNVGTVYINKGTYSIESNDGGLGDGNVQLASGASLKVWGGGRNIVMGAGKTVTSNGGTISFYGNEVLEKIDTTFTTEKQSFTGNLAMTANTSVLVSPDFTWTGDISGAGYKLTKTHYNNRGRGDWKFVGTTADHTTVTLGSLSVDVGAIRLKDYADMTVSGAITGNGNIDTTKNSRFEVSANATLSAGSVTGISDLTLNGTSTIGTLTMPGGTITANAGVITETPTNTMTGNLVVGANPLTMDVATNLKTTGTMTGLTTSEIIKNGAGTWVLSNAATTGYAGKLTIHAGTVKVNGMGSSTNAFADGFSMTIDNGATLDVRGALCSNASKITVGAGGATILAPSNSHLGLSNVFLEDTLNLGGTSRTAITLYDNDGNGQTINVTNPYVYVGTELKNVDLVIQSGGKIAYEKSQNDTATSTVTLESGTLSTWFGNVQSDPTTFTYNPIRLGKVDVASNGGTITIDGGVLIDAPITMSGNLNVQNMEGNNKYGSMIQFSQTVSGAGKTLTLKKSTLETQADVTLGTMTLQSGCLNITGGTFTADTYNILQTRGTETQTYANAKTAVRDTGLVINGGTLISTGTFNAENKKVELRSGTLKLGGTVSGTAVLDAMNGTLWIADGMNLASTVNLADAATLEIGLDATASEITLQNANLAGTVNVDILSDGSTDMLNVAGDGVLLDDATFFIELPTSFDSGVTPLFTVATGLSAEDWNNLSVAFNHSGWAADFANGTLHVRDVNATPEPAAWLLLLLGLLGQGVARKKGEKG